MSLFDPEPVYLPSELQDIKFPEEGFVLYVKLNNSEDLMGHQVDGKIYPYFFECLDDAYDRLSTVEEHTGLPITVKRMKHREINSTALMYKGFNTKDILVENV